MILIPRMVRINTLVSKTILTIIQVITTISHLGLLRQTCCCWASRKVFRTQSRACRSDLVLAFGTRFSVGFGV